jgi:hypothetical protein
MRAIGKLRTSKIRHSRTVLAVVSSADSTACHCSGGSGGMRINIAVTSRQPGRRAGLSLAGATFIALGTYFLDRRSVPDHPAASMSAPGRPPCFKARSIALHRHQPWKLRADVDGSSVSTECVINCRCVAPVISAKRPGRAISRTTNSATIAGGSLPRAVPQVIRPRLHGPASEPRCTLDACPLSQLR